MKKQLSRHSTYRFMCSIIDDNMNKSDKKEVNPNGVTMKKSEDGNNQKGGNNQPNNDAHHENELKKPDILF